MRKSFESLFEVETIPGLGQITATEILNAGISNIETGTDFVRFRYDGAINKLAQFKTAVSVYALLRYDVPRPRALLGHQHFTRLTNSIQAVLAVEKSSYSTFNLNAAGSDSSVMNRIKQAITEATGLQNSDTGGDLFVRIRRHKPGWDVLIRLTPRPLSTRFWRICDYEGALNAPVAHAMVIMSQPSADQAVLNIGCGSASIMIERFVADTAKQLVGIDNAPHALDCASHNLIAAAALDHTHLIKGDARSLPFMSRSFDTLLADLPFGQRIGSHENNQTLYPEILNEAARVARHHARFVLITHEIRLMSETIRHSNIWALEREIKINLRGLHPRIYILRRS